MNIILMLGAILSLLSVVNGAYFEHGLKLYLNPNSKHMMEIALRHHELYALLITVLGLSEFSNFSARILFRIKATAWIFIIGIFLFSGSIYCYIATTNASFLHAAPFGGTFLMLGWVLLFWTGCTSKLKKINH